MRRCAMYTDLCWCPCERMYCTHMVCASVCVPWLVKKECCPICLIPAVWCPAGATPARCDGETRSGPRSADESKPKTDLCPAHWLWAGRWGGTVGRAVQGLSDHHLYVHWVLPLYVLSWLATYDAVKIVRNDHRKWQPPLITANVTGYNHNIHTYAYH